MFLCVGGWTVLRLMVASSPAPPLDRLAETRPPVERHAEHAQGATTVDPRRHMSIRRASAAAVHLGSAAAAGPQDMERAPPMLQNALPSMAQAAEGGQPPSAEARDQRAAPIRLAMGTGEGLSVPRNRGGWSLESWLYLRTRSNAGRDDIARFGQLGGSQAGARLAYGFGDSGRVSAFGRATIDVRQSQQRQLDLGVAFAPLANWPVLVAVERRMAIGPDGRNAMAATVMGGVSAVALPAAFELDAYGQAGVVGVRRRDGFVDDAIAVDHDLGLGRRARLRLGGLVAGALQPHVARVDIGPRMTLRLPMIGNGGRIMLDWRQRVAGQAEPDSGVALTLAAGF